MRQRLTRRDFLKILRVGFIHFLALALGAMGYSVLVEPGFFQVENVRLRLRRLPPSFSGFRAAQISDIHMGGWMTRPRLQQVAELIVAQQPDVLLITGDFILGRASGEPLEQALQELREVLRPLAATIPSFSVLGNHDYWTDAAAVRQMLESCAITDLTNSVFTLDRAGEQLHLCGVDDVWEGQVRLDRVLAQLPENGAALLLAHEPDFADTSAATGRFDLQISGHTHGGQVTLPFVGSPILPHLGRRYPSGLYRVGDMLQYTNRGVGMGRLPIRWNCPAEITVFELERSSE